jgi:predicted NAD/FAD-dependent oxidoreductase
MAGKILSQAGIDNLILEKSRGVGGRMATRRFENGVFDHGAQFFTARERKFQKWVSKWQEIGTIKEWFGHKLPTDSISSRESHSRFIGTKGMTSVPKEVAKGLQIKTDTWVKSISQKEDLWVAHTNDGDEYSAKRIILSAPIPQSLSLLEAGGISLPKKENEALLAINYQQCIAGLVLLKSPSAIPSPGKKKFEEGAIQWLGDNSQKGISPDMPAVTIHAAAEFSRKNFALAPEELANLLIAASRDWLGQEVLAWQIHKWHYSQAVTKYPERFLALPGLSGLYMVGDGFGGARVEGAAISGIEAAIYIREKVFNHVNSSPAD